MPFWEGVGLWAALNVEMAAGKRIGLREWVGALAGRELGHSHTDPGLHGVALGSLQAAACR